MQRLPLLVLNRTVDRKHPVPYHVIDKLPPKGSKDWDRVAAVFVHGPGWQVRGEAQWETRLTRTEILYIRECLPLEGQPPNPAENSVAATFYCEQFKDFPHKGAATGDLVDVFLSISGFYAHYHNEKVPDNVRSWKVTVLLDLRLQNLDQARPGWLPGPVCAAAVWLLSSGHVCFIAATILQVVDTVLHRENRNNDVHLMRQFWRSLDGDLASRKSKLKY